MSKLSSVAYSVGLIISALVGFLHFFAPRTFGWYAYIPDAPPAIYVSMDYINFLFSLLLTGLSVLLLAFKQRAFRGSPEILAFYLFLAVVWLSRLLITLVIPWPSPLHVWLLVAAATESVILLVPVAQLVQGRQRIETA